MFERVWSSRPPNAPGQPQHGILREGYVSQEVLGVWIEVADQKKSHKKGGALETRIQFIELNCIELNLIQLN